MRHNRSIFAAIAGAVLLVAGCGSGGSESVPTISATAPSTTVASATTAGSAAAGPSGTEGDQSGTGGDQSGAGAGTGSDVGAGATGSGGTGSGAGDAGSGGDQSGTAPPEGGGSDLGPAAGNGLCLDTSSDAVWSILGGIDSGTSAGSDWVIREASTDPIDNCPDLSYLVVDVSGATASSPSQILFFHNGTYLGTGTAEPTIYTTIVGTSADSVTAQYQWIAGDEPNCCPEGGPSTVTYSWNGAGVGAEGEFPPYL